ncbi:MAG: DNA ligase D, partial [Polyangiaceae bacterium]
LLACKAGDDVRLYTRRGNDWTDRFRPIAEGVRRLPARECVVDGEVCVVDEGGRPSFHALQEWLGGSGASARIGFAAFDLLWLDGRDLRPEPIEARRELLEKLLEGQPPPLSYSRAVAGDPRQLLEAARQGGLEGLMAKRKGSTYVSGRSSSWMKLRFDRRQECAVIGWIPLSGDERSMGALVLAVVEDGKLVHAGRVGTGFTDHDRREWAKKLAPDEVEGPGASRAPRAPHAERVPATRGAHWVEPKIVVECAFTEWTGEGAMRHPRFLGLREDKGPMDCLREPDDADRELAAVAATVRPAPAAPRTPASKLSNPDKVLFPRDGITKKQIWDYYGAIAPVMLPHLAGRPINLQRYPDGIDGEEWYQQNAPPKMPPFVHQIDVGPRHGNKHRIVCDSVDSLQYLANLAALTIHQWCCHVPPGVTGRAGIDHALACPDYVVLDLDPGDGPWAHLIQVALAVRTLLDALSLESVVKTSGKRGLHVLVPIAPGPTHDQATGFAEQVARAVAKVLPDVATVERMKDKRSGKLYVDYGQNGEGRTIVSPYTIRARDGAVVSTPLRWDEVTEALDPTRFTIRTVLERVSKHGDLFAGVLGSRQRLPG